MVGSVALLSSLARAQPVPESVYPPPEPLASEDPRGPSATGAKIELEVDYLTDYVWRGIERFDAGRAEDSANVQYDAKVRFDLGKIPSPYVKLFVNTATGDPVSTFEEVRPEAGFDWNVRPLTISAGYTTYIFPDRQGLDTSEVYLQLRLDDSLLFRSERPILSPYVFAAYDFDQWQGLYVEAGIRHEVPIEQTGLTLAAYGHAAYVNGFDLFGTGDGQDSGFQHWQVGVEARYELNKLLNIPDRFGQFSVVGYVNYTDRIESSLAATNQIWGGAGIRLSF